MGPVIVDSKTGRPFEYEEFRKRWRIIAQAAGIPDEVQNRDSRAGGITEARNAGADKDDIRQLAGHADVETTEIYIRENLEPLQPCCSCASGLSRTKDSVITEPVNHVKNTS
jgi:integrase